jgi:hypothetical protein
LESLAFPHLSFYESLRFTPHHITWLCAHPPPQEVLSPSLLGPYLLQQKDPLSLWSAGTTTGGIVRGILNAFLSVSVAPLPVS